MDASTKAEGVDVWAFRWLIDCGIVQVQLGRKGVTYAAVSRIVLGVWGCLGRAG